MNHDEIRRVLHNKLLSEFKCVYKAVKKLNVNQSQFYKWLKGELDAPPAKVLAYYKIEVEYKLPPSLDNDK